MSNRNSNNAFYRTTFAPLIGGACIGTALSHAQEGNIDFASVIAFIGALFLMFGRAPDEVDKQ